jgi:hypothetical protein
MGMKGRLAACSSKAGRKVSRGGMMKGCGTAPPVELRCRCVGIYLSANFNHDVADCASS